ncbi:MAG: class I SAM-dependent methyltransferase [Phycisphaerales bacterium]|nr:class I SAM-dependent methyltransferase [Phycisphaerales bacterium]
MTQSFWNERYGSQELVYGEAANEFLVGMADRCVLHGRALDIGAGEGRNALFWAARGLDVLAVDQSDVGMRKAQEMARKRGLHLRTLAADLREYVGEPAAFDVVSSIFVHLPSDLRALVHRRVVEWLKPGGVFILEAYGPEQISRNTGGPKEPALLASLETILGELSGLKIEHRAALVRDVKEGAFHSGTADVVQVVARRV